MTSPGNTTVPKPNAATLNSRTSALRIALIAAFVATCVFFVFFFVSAAFQHDRANGHAAEPMWVVLLAAGFLLAPYIVSWFLLSTREPKAVATGAGVAGGFFGAFLIVSPYAVMVMLMFLGLSATDRGADHGLMAAGLTLLVFMAISLWIVRSAFRIGKTQWNAFGVAIGATAFYLFFGFQSLSLTAFRGQRHAEQKRVQSEMEMYKPAMLARQKVLALSACVLRHHMLHPAAGYPASIDPLPPAYNCEPSLPADPIPEFTFIYTPQTDPAAGRVTDFQLTGMPGQKGVRGREPLLIDSRGIVFVDYPWEMHDVTPKVMVMPSDLPNSQLDSLKLNLDFYMRDKSNGVAPASLSSAIFPSPAFEPPIVEEGRTRLESRDYEILYWPPKAGEPSRFAISARCKRYGEICLRSYLIDYDGSIHATGEPRQATAEDPAPLRCENANSECEDVIWDPV